MANETFIAERTSNGTYRYRGHIIWKRSRMDDVIWKIQDVRGFFYTLEDAMGWLDEDFLPIRQIERVRDYNELMSLEKVLFNSGQPSNVIMAAIEKRQGELYTPTAKDIAEAELDEGLRVQNENINRGWQSAYILQAKRNCALWLNYNNAEEG